MTKKYSTELESPIQDSVRQELENSSMPFNLTQSDRELLKTQYNVVVFSHDCDPNLIDKKQFPSDSVLITYEIEGKITSDHVRGPKLVKIFDAYYDFLTPFGGRILTMEPWYGMVNPKLWGNRPKKTK